MGSLAVGVAKEIKVIVTAQDETTTKTYTITVTRQATALSNDATMSGLSVGNEVLSPPFTAGTTSYAVAVAKGITSVTVTPTVNESHATVAYKVDSADTAAVAGSLTVNSLTVGVAKEIKVIVTAQDETTTKTYTISVVRSKLLSGLTIKSGQAELDTLNLNSEDTSFNVDTESNSVIVIVPVFDSDEAPNVDPDINIIKYPYAQITYTVGTDTVVLKVEPDLTGNGASVSDDNSTISFFLDSVPTTCTITAIDQGITNKYTVIIN